MATPRDENAAEVGTAGDPPTARALEGLEHLQIAARELIEAARAMLDVAEELVADPAAVASLVSTFGSLADAAVRMMPGAATEQDHEGTGDDERIQRIKVS